MRTIRHIAWRIAEQFDVEKIILFGSHAGGKPHLQSDVDLCVIMKSVKQPFKQSLQILQALSPLYFGIDVIVKSSEEIERRIRGGDCFLQISLKRENPL